MIFNIMACKVVKRGIPHPMEIREASYTPINPLHTTHKSYIPRSIDINKETVRMGTFIHQEWHILEQIFALSQKARKIETRKPTLSTSLVRAHKCMQIPYLVQIPFLNSSVWSGSGLLVGENEVSAECPLGPISVPSSRRVIGTMLAQDNVRGFQRFYSTRNLIQFLERPRSPQGRKEQ